MKSREDRNNRCRGMPLFLLTPHPQTFQQTPVMERRLIIGNRNSPNMTREMVHRRPNYKQYQLSTKLQLQFDQSTKI